MTFGSLFCASLFGHGGLHVIDLACRCFLFIAVVERRGIYASLFISDFVSRGFACRCFCLQWFLDVEVFVCHGFCASRFLYFAVLWVAVLVCRFFACRSFCALLYLPVAHLRDEDFESMFLTVAVFVRRGFCLVRSFTCHCFWLSLYDAVSICQRFCL